jgi:hypothetical protein
VCRAADRIGFGLYGFGVRVLDMLRRFPMKLERA